MAGYANDAPTCVTAPRSPTRNLMRTIGVISDTHGLLRQEALDALQGSELIIHAGDVGNQEILDALGYSPEQIDALRERGIL